MKRKLFIFFLIVTGSITAGVESCKKEKSTTTTSATITALACSSATFSGSPTASSAFTGTATVPYTGGSGASYSAGTAISSTGVTGLTATLQAGILASGAGSLIYAIAGTPSASGTASFAITFGGQSCSFAMTVGTATTGTTGCSTSGTIASQVVCLAQTFLATLSTSQQASVVLTLNKTNALRWSNLPCGLSCRNGLLLSSLSSTQLAAAKAVAQAAFGTTTGEG